MPDGEDKNPTPKRADGKADDESASSKTLRPHDRDRISTWREKQKKDDVDKEEQKTFLTAQQKRKIAYINQDFHSEADTVNAYVVFAHQPPAESRSPNLPPPPPVMDPYEAARLTVERCDGTTFMDRRIRVDRIVKPDKNDRRATGGGDLKSSIFVGNLDFATKDDDLRVFFEGVVSAERGPPTSLGLDKDEEEEEEEADASWVTRVRIVRDKDTQLGKGFAYVQFAVRTIHFDSSMHLLTRDTGPRMRR